MLCRVCGGRGRCSDPHEGASPHLWSGGSPLGAVTGHQPPRRPSPPASPGAQGLPSPCWWLPYWHGAGELPGAQWSPDKWIKLWYEEQCVSHCPAFVGLEQRREWCRAPIAPKIIYPVSPGYSLCFPSRNQDAKNHMLFPIPEYKELCVSKSPHWKWLPGDPVHHSSHPLRELMSI